MDDKILKMTSILALGLTLIICTSLYFFPGLRTKAIALREEKKTEIAKAEIVIPVSAIAEEIPEEGIKAQLQIGIRDDIAMDDIEIENDYMSQTVWITIPNADDDYFSEHELKGSSDHIADFTYYTNQGNLVLKIGLDQVYEVSQQCDKGKLYLNFVDPHEIYSTIVVIDAGHGGKAVGAVKQGVYEKTIDLEIVQKLKELFEQNQTNIGVYYTRLDDSNPSLAARANLANKAKADMFISVHNNSSSSGKMTNFSGTQVLYHPTDTYEQSSERLAQLLLDHVCEQTQSNSIGLAARDDIYIIRASECPVALIEVGFMTNSKELALLQEEEYQKKTAQGIYDAIQQAIQEGF